MRQNENQQFEFLDLITIMSFYMQTMDYNLTVEQASNNDILKELKKDMAELRGDIQLILNRMSLDN